MSSNIDALLQLAGLVSELTPEEKEKYAQPKKERKPRAGGFFRKAKKQETKIPVKAFVPPIVPGFKLGAGKTVYTLPDTFETPAEFLTCLNKTYNNEEIVQVLRRAEKLLNLSFDGAATVGNELDRFRFAARSLMKPETASEYKRSIIVSGFVAGAANHEEKFKNDIKSRIRVAEERLTDIRSGKAIGDVDRIEKILKAARKELNRHS